LDGEAIVLDLHSSTYFRANRTGTVILKALVEGCDRAGLVTRVAEAYDLAEGEVAADVDAFVARLAERGLLAG
jgi:hypothetical protein